MSSAPQPAPSPFVSASTALLLAVLACLLGALAWVESHNLNQPLMLGLNHLLNAQAPGQPVAPLASAWWSGITVMGLGLSMFLVFGIWAERQPGWMAAYLLCLLIGGLLVHLVKHAIDAPRPPAVLSLSELHVIGSVLRTRSMPSGHSASAFAFAAVMLLSPNPWSLRRLLLVPVLVAATLIALSRIAVGAHWPLDVLVGSALGWVFGGMSVALAATSGLTRWCASRPGRWVLTLTWFGAGLAMCTQQTGYPQAVPLQWALGLACAAGALWRAHRLWAQRGAPAA
ncbi:phosphatase PAP2 family protein [Aquabacterium sp.]|uniref:phosphatase PAP2 family protein n=1 Tax=Aquabacterium sp. TaxID=1872578 RepID=UPI0035B48A19